MENLRVFITVVLPTSLCVMAAFFGLLAVIGPYLIQARWDREDAICDELDEFHYDVKQHQIKLREKSCLNTTDVANIIAAEQFLKTLNQYAKHTGIVLKVEYKLEDEYVCHQG